MTRLSATVPLLGRTLMLCFGVGPTVSTTTSRAMRFSAVGVLGVVATSANTVTSASNRSRPEIGSGLLHHQRRPMVPSMVPVNGLFHLAAVWLPAWSPLANGWVICWRGVDPVGSVSLNVPPLIWSVGAPWKKYWVWARTPPPGVTRGDV